MFEQPGVSPLKGCECHAKTMKRALEMERKNEKKRLAHAGTVLTGAKNRDAGRIQRTRGQIIFGFLE